MFQDISPVVRAMRPPAETNVYRPDAEFRTAWARIAKAEKRGETAKRERSLGERVRQAISRA